MFQEFRTPVIVKEHKGNVIGVNNVIRNIGSRLCFVRQSAQENFAPDEMQRTAICNGLSIPVDGDQDSVIFFHFPVTVQEPDNLGKCVLTYELCSSIVIDNVDMRLNADGHGAVWQMSTLETNTELADGTITDLPLGAADTTTQILCPEEVTFRQSPGTGVATDRDWETAP